MIHAPALASVIAAAEKRRHDCERASRRLMQPLTATAIMLTVARGLRKDRCALSAEVGGCRKRGRWFMSWSGLGAA